MPDTPDKPGLKPANQNPWYLLMTVCGEQDGEVIDEDLHARNRRIWNGWAAQSLGEAEKQALVDEGRAIAADLEPLTGWERAKMRERFQGAGADFPKPNTQVDLSHTVFCKILCASEFIFPNGPKVYHSTFKRIANFNGSTSRGHNFAGVTFCDDAYFKHYIDRLTGWFGGAKFERNAIFSGSKFGDNREFRYVDNKQYKKFDYRIESNFGPIIVDGNIKLNKCNFTGGINLNGAKLLKVDFSNSIFDGEALFEKTKFRGDCDFTNCKFGSSTRFENSEFEIEPPRLYGATLHEDTDWSDVKWPNLPERRAAKGAMGRLSATIRHHRTVSAHRRAYERLKLLMAEQHKFRDEQFFLRKELACGEVVDGFPKNIPSRLYGFLSDYGASIGRPVAGLAAVAALGWGAFVYEKCPGWLPFSGAECNFLGRGLGLSLSNTFGVFGFARVFHLDTLRGLGAFSQSVSAVQALLGIILIFLIGLALRNRFRIK